MEISDLFMIRRALVESGFKDDAAEKVTIALENGMASKIDAVMAKWEAKMDVRFAAIDARFEAVDARFKILERDMTIRLGLMLVAAVGIFATIVKLMH